MNIPGIEPRRCRVKIDAPQDYTPVSKEVFEAEATPAEEVVEAPKTQEERMAEIQARFDIMDDMTEATKEGTVRALILSGPPGIGNS